ncbi:MAG: hypothetical protein KJ559_04270 [Nanoarchaeota archaeon]|nr:hypothetical protein [Nanoarchaeota archaeon]
MSGKYNLKPSDFLFGGSYRYEKRTGANKILFGPVIEKHFMENYIANRDLFLSCCDILWTSAIFMGLLGLEKLIN